MFRILAASSHLLALVLTLVSALLVASGSAMAAPGEISGQITLAKGVTLKPGGALFVLAKEAGKAMPVAVARIPAPKFPYTFKLSGRDSMMPGSPFTGPFVISARYSPTGDAMDKSGPEGAVAKPVAVGTDGLKIEMKAK